MKDLARSTVAVLCAMIFLSTICAQESVLTRKIGIGITTGYPAWGLWKGIEDGLIDHGFDVTRPCTWFCTGTVKHPHSDVFPFIELDMHYSNDASKWFGMRLGISEAGESFGYKGSSFQSSFLFIGYTHYGWAPYMRLLSKTGKFYFEGSAGISWIRIKQTSSSHSINKYEHHTIKPKTSAAVGLFVFKKKRAFMTLDFRYQYVPGQIRIGPFEEPQYGIEQPPQILMGAFETVSHIFNIGLTYGWQINAR